MTNHCTNYIIEELNKNKEEYLSSVAKVEDISDPVIRKEASQIIEASIIHETIALEEMQN